VKSMEIYSAGTISALKGSGRTVARSM